MSLSRINLAVVILLCFLNGGLHQDNMTRCRYHITGRGCGKERLSGPTRHTHNSSEGLNRPFKPISFHHFALIHEYHPFEFSEYIRQNRISDFLYLDTAHTASRVIKFCLQRKKPLLFEVRIHMFFFEVNQPLQPVVGNALVCDK